MKSKIPILRLKILLSLLVPVIFFVLVFGFSGFGKVFEYDTDEGLCLMRAFLHTQGHPFYKEIWMDQPPFLMLLLSGLIKIFGPSVFYARLLILIFSSLLLWGLFQIIKETQNLLSALMAVILLILSSFYIRLSVSVLIGLPAIALAVLSSYGVFLYQKGYKRRYLLLSGVLLALGLQTKLFVIVFLPAIICEIIMIEKDRIPKGNLIGRSLSALLWWFLALTGVYLYISLATPVDYSQIIKPHIIVAKKLADSWPGYRHVLGWFRQEYDIALLAIGAVIFLKRKERRFFFIPFISLLLGVLLFSVHSPVWYTYKLLFTTPMCWLASFSIYKLFSRQLWKGWRGKNKIIRIKDTLTIVFLSLVLILTVVRTPLKYQRMVKGMEGHSFNEYRYVIHLMKRYKKQTHLVVTDRPIFPFYAGLATHPYLATCSWKRQCAGFLTAKDYIDIISKEQPELILFARFRLLRDDIVPHIKKDYDLEYQGPHNRVNLYVLKGIKRNE